MLNGIDDFDGCPDTGGAVVAELDGDRVTAVGAAGLRPQGPHQGRARS
ncbi:MAG: hypothetical protein HS111_06465 [Kofleriaceae bacterium]|nr:hypothetical protein [Kofleriaceae bacterium]